MATTRKQQAEVERLRKKVLEGVDQFETLWVRAQLTENRAQRKRSCNELKKEVKKLRRLREQVRTLISSSELRDKTTLDELRKLTETQMERYERFERQLLAKAFSTATLSRGAGGELTRESARAELVHWLEGCVDTLQAQLQHYEQDAETVSGARKPLSREATRRLSTLAKRREQHEFHISHLSQLAASCADAAQRVDIARIQRIRDDVDHYVASSSEPDFQDNEFLYEDLVDDDTADDTEVNHADEGDLPDETREDEAPAQDSLVGRGDCCNDCELLPSAPECSRVTPNVVERLELKPSASERLSTSPRSAERQLDLRTTCSSQNLFELKQPNQNKSRSGTLGRQTTPTELRPKSPEFARSRTPERWDEDAEARPKSPKHPVQKVVEGSAKKHEDIEVNKAFRGCKEVASHLVGAWKLRAEERCSVLGERRPGDGQESSSKTDVDCKVDRRRKTDRGGKADGCGNKDGHGKEEKSGQKNDGGKKKTLMSASWTHAQRSEVFLSWFFQDYVAIARKDRQKHGHRASDATDSWFTRLPPVDITYFTRSPSATDPLPAWHECAASLPMSIEEQWRSLRLTDSYNRLNGIARPNAEPGDSHSWSAARDCMH